MEDSPMTFEDLDNLCEEALAAYEEGSYEKARSRYMKALSTCDSLMDDDYRVSIRQYLGMCYYRLGVFKEAARYDRKTLEILTSRKDGGGTKVVVLRHNLARDLSAIHDVTPLDNLDKLEEAIILHDRNLEDLQAIHERKAELLETKYSLAFDLAKLSRFLTDTAAMSSILERAADLNQQVVRARERSNPGDPLTLQSRHNLASVLYHQKEYPEAKELLLRNQKEFSALSSTEKKEHAVLRQSTERFLAACCEATKDISLSIKQITKKSKKPRKPSTASKDVKVVSKIAIHDDASGGRLLNADDATAVVKPKAAPTGLASSSSYPQGGPLTSNGGIVPSSSYSGIATGGSSKVHMGNATTNVHATNIHNHYYYNSPHPVPDGVSHSSHPQPHPSFSLEAPTSQNDGVQRSISHGHVLQSNLLLHTATAAKPRSSSGVRTQRSPSRNPVRRSRSVSNPELSGTDSRVGDKRMSVPEIRTASSDDSDERSRGRRKDRIREKPSHQTTSLHPVHSSESRSSTSRHTPQIGSERVANGSWGEASPTGNKADKWFSDLREHTHALLHYNNKPQIPHRRRVRVAIIDSGLDRPPRNSVRRPDILRHRHRFCRYRDFTLEGTRWTDSDHDLHGTNCASILLQVAPHVDLYIANVVKRSTGKPSPSSVALALEWALEKEVDIISMSLGFDTMYEDISKQIDLARLGGVLIFAAASNDGPNAPDWGVFPAWLSNVFCINSADVDGAMSWFNPKYTDEKLNFAFLGEQIAILDEHNHTPLSDPPRLTGTSFATPIAAGTAALVLDLVRMQNIEDQYPKIEICLKTYEGMSAVFKRMSSPPTAFGAEFYNVRPWRLLGKKGPPLSRADEPNESKQWYALLKVVECLAKFGEFDTGIATMS